MAVNKNFVIKNGLEVSTQLILADANTNKVGIGSTGPRFELDVAGGIGATDSYVSGISTVLGELNVGTDGSVLTALGTGSSVGVGTALPGYLLDVRSPVSTGQTALYVYGDMRVTGDINLDDITLDDASIQNLTVTEALNVTSSGISTFEGHVNLTDTLQVSGISTLGGYLDLNAAADISSTLNVGGATTVGGYLDVNDAVDLSGTLNVGGATTVGGYLDVNDAVDLSGTLNVGGATTVGGYLDVNNSLDVSTDLNVAGISTLSTVKISSGIVTAASGIVTYYGDGSQLSGVIGGIGIATVGGDLGFGVTFLKFLGSGISSSHYDSSVGIATIYITAGVSTSINGVGIQSGGVVIGTGVTILNFVGTGNTFAVVDDRVDISIQGGGGGGVSTSGILSCRGVANSSVIMESIEFDDSFVGGTNYAMVGPITVVGAGVTVTVGAGVSYVII